MNNYGHVTGSYIATTPQPSQRYFLPLITHPVYADNHLMAEFVISTTTWLRFLLLFSLTLEKVFGLDVTSCPLLGGLERVEHIQTSQMLICNDNMVVNRIYKLRLP